MAYIGNQPTDNFVTFATQNFTTSATSSYTLSHAVSNENEIALFINNVRQHPGSGKAYTASGTALTLSANTASTDVMYCIFLGRAIQSTVPATNSITAAMVSDNAISEEHLDVTAITGQTAETSIADGDTILIHDASASALRKMTKANFVSGVGGTNTPNFFASITSDFSINDNTLTKIPFSNEVFDTGSNYDPSTNYRYTPGFVGKSFLACAIFSSNAGNNVYKQDIQLYKNGSSIVYHQDQQSDARQWKQNMMFLNVVVSHDADDYYEIYGKVVTTNSSTTHYPTGSGNNATFRNYFYGYKIIE